MNQAHIMVVEDEAIVGVDIKECLESFNYSVTGPISSGEEALEVARSERPKLVLMDIMLNGALDGISAAQQMRSKLGIPVVFLTAYADRGTLARAKVTEPYGYILKPFKKMELPTVIELALHRFQSDLSRQQQVNEPDRNREAAFKSEIAKLEKRGLSAPDRRSLVDFIQKIEPFKQFSLETLEALAETCGIERVKAGDFIMFESDEQMGPFIVMSGRLALIKSSASGKDLIVEIIMPNDPFGLLVALEKKSATFSIKAQIDSTLATIPRQIVKYLIEHEAGQRLIEKILERLRKSHDMARALAHDRVEVRVASALLAMIRPFENGNGTHALEVKLSRQELADMTGTAPETASRVANAFEREGLVDLSRSGMVKIVNVQGLCELIEYSDA